ncbi:MAG: OsmC family protein [Gemmatimonadetes bacterium]|nr:OsmC family protein [Gemmatimonadota bacterium]
MPDSSIHLRWTGEGLVFTGGRDETAEATFDGNGRAGISPVLTLLFALASCTGSDVIEIATKMRVPVATLDIAMEGDRAPEPPRRYVAIRVTYHVTGVAAKDHDKIRRAVQLSEEKYCSVFHTLRTDLDYSSDIVFG